MKICHLTSVHYVFDTRVFYKECCSLAEAGHDVWLVASGIKDQKVNGVNIVGITKRASRIQRMLFTVAEAKKKAIAINADVYHFHDPELILVGLYLLRSGKKVIFDIHENIAKQIMSKSYLPKILRIILSKCYHPLNMIVAKKFHLVLAESSYEEIYSPLNADYTTILNLPDYDFFQQFQAEERDIKQLFYIGGLSQERGYNNTIKALTLLSESQNDLSLHLVGNYSESQKNDVPEGLKTRVHFYGRLKLADGYEISRRCGIGLAILHPVKNYIESYPTKIFEYMSLGIPVITSNFPLYKSIVETHHCGLCVDPLDPEAVAQAISYLINNPDVCKEMGENGKKAIIDKLNWSHEKNKLVAMYDDLVAHKIPAKITNEKPVVLE